MKKADSLIQGCESDLTGGRLCGNLPVILWLTKRPEDGGRGVPALRDTMGSRVGSLSRLSLNCPGIGLRDARLTVPAGDSAVMAAAPWNL